MPWGERSGRVASSDSRLYIRMEDWPPMRRCLFVPWEASSWVMKETWSALRAVVAFLDVIVSYAFSSFFLSFNLETVEFLLKR